MRPADFGGLLKPELALVFLGLAQAAGSALLAQDLLLVFDAERVPVDVFVGDIFFRVAENLSVAFAEEIDRLSGNVDEDDGLLVFVVGDAGAERAQAIGEAGLEIGPIFEHAVRGERAGVDRADVAVVGDDEIGDDVVEMEMRVAGHRGVDQIGGAVAAVLKGEGRAGGVVAEGEPADVAAFEALFAAMPPAGEAEVGGGVAQGVVVGGDEGVADRRRLRWKRGELRRQRYRFMRRENEVEGADFALLLRPGFASVGAPRFEQVFQFVARRGARRRDPQRVGDGARHVLAKPRPFVAGGVVGGEPVAGFEFAPGRVDSGWVGLRGLFAAVIFGEDLAFAGGGDFLEVQHDLWRSSDDPVWSRCSAWPASMRATPARICLESSMLAACWAIRRPRRSSRRGPASSMSFGSRSASRRCSSDITASFCCWAESALWSNASCPVSSSGKGVFQFLIYFGSRRCRECSGAEGRTADHACARIAQWNSFRDERVSQSPAVGGRALSVPCRSGGRTPARQRDARRAGGQAAASSRSCARAVCLKISP